MASQFPKPLSFALVTDLDHTLVRHRHHETHEDLMEFNREWQTRFAKDGLLVYSTGRSPEMYSRLRNSVPMLTPDALVCSVGTEIFWRQENGKFQADETWSRQLDDRWNMEAVKDLQTSLDPKIFSLQERSEQRRHKLSLNLEVPNSQGEKIEALRRLLEEKGIRAQVIFSGGWAVDILPVGAGKGKALTHILNQLRAQGRYPSHGIQVNGDSGNDIDLFKVPGVRGCIVSNAHPELRQWADDHAHEYDLFKATQPCASGIVQALRSSDAYDRSLPDQLVAHVLHVFRHLSSTVAFNSICFLETFFELWNGSNKISVENNQQLRDALDIQPDQAVCLDGIHQEILSSDELMFAFHLCKIRRSEKNMERISTPARILVHRHTLGSDVHFKWSALHVTPSNEGASYGAFL